MIPEELPETIYVSIEEAGTEDEFLSINKTPEDAAELGKSKRIGIYKLQRIASLETKTELK